MHGFVNFDYLALKAMKEIFCGNIADLNQKLYICKHYQVRLLNKDGLFLFKNTGNGKGQERT